jgi:hypothetical protein
LEIKKSKQADLENKRWVGFMLGLIIALSAFFVAMEYTSNGGSDNNEDAKKITSVRLHSLDMLPAIDQTNVAKQKNDEKPTVEDMLNIKRSDTPVKVTPHSNGSMQSNDKVTAAPQVSNDIILSSNPIVLPPVPKVEQEAKKPTTKMSDDDAVKDIERYDDKVSKRILSETPTPPGGWVEFMKWLTKSLQYPVASKEAGVEGIVNVSFIISENGIVSAIKIKNSKDKNMEAEVLRVVNSMGKWKPGLSKNKPCKSMVEIPVVFKL